MQTSDTISDADIFALWQEYIDLCRRLAAHGFPDERRGSWINVEQVYAPGVDDLIVALGDKFGVLERFHNGRFGAYIPNDCGVNGIGATPEIALMRLWLAVQGMEDGAGD